MSGRLAVDTNAVIVYREGIFRVCRLVEGAEAHFLPVVVLGELLYGAANSAKRQRRTSKQCADSRHKQSSCQ